MADTSSPTTRTPRRGLVAIDLDGTLLSPAGEVTPRCRAAVAAVAAAGYAVCFATGRTWPESRRVIDAAGHRDLAVFVGGGAVVDTATGATVSRTVMHGGLAADVCRFFETRGHAALALQDRAESDVDYLVSAEPPMGAETRVWMDVSGAAVRLVGDLGAYRHRHTMRVSAVAHSTVTAVLLAELAGGFGDRVVSHSVGVHAYDVDVMEVFDPAVDKWQGIKRVAAHHGVGPADVVGDGMNDLPMIRGAGLGVAMGNAKPAVKAAAGRVIGPNDADGLAIFLEELAAA